jgi:hypothetical protein
MAKLLGRVAKVVNVPMLMLAKAPVIGPVIRKTTVTITYTGRRSGKTFTLPVSYKRSGDQVTIRVGLPDAKSWWRNFTGDGAPITVDFDEGPRRGYAVATRDASGRVTVQVQLTDRS